MRKWISAFLALVFALAIARLGFAEDNTITGLAPTMNTDGTALTDLAAIRLYHKVDGGAYALLETQPFDSEGQQFEFEHEVGQGVHCYVSTAVDAQGNESDPSNETCKSVDTLAPGAPSNLSVN